jgi:hypothetical protein
MTCRGRGADGGALIALLAALLGGAACVPMQHTIGGHGEATIAQWESEASRMCLRRTGQEPPQRFTTDGCTLWPDATWQACCVEHDMAYWCGGSAAARLDADAKLKACVAGTGHPGTAEVMHRAVRVGGHPFVPTFSRWGYGWTWPRGYTGGQGR